MVRKGSPVRIREEAQAVTGPEGRVAVQTRGLPRVGAA